MLFSLTEVVPALPDLCVVDVGASEIDGPPPYQSLLARGLARVIGFEPSPEAFAQLATKTSERTTYLPYALGDGRDATLHICRAPGMTSLLEPDLEVLRHFHGFEQWATVVRREPVSTRRLDDIAEISRVDFLKLDVQGSELAVLQGATRRLADAVAVQLEVQFIPFYRGQPLFAELDLELRRAGFWLHRFAPLASRVLRPMMLNNDPYAGLSQVLWSDAVYVRPFSQLGELPPDALLRLALVAHEVYGSFDLAALALGHIDRKTGSAWQERYLTRLAQAGRKKGAPPPP